MKLFHSLTIQQKPPKDTGRIVALWMETGRLIHERMFEENGTKRVNPLQIFAMYLIEHRQGITMKELAGHLGVTSSSATALVNRLVRMKWVVRRNDPKNRRLVRLKAAPKGRKMLSAVMQKQAKTMRDILSLLEAADRRDFASILIKLHRALSRGLPS